MKTKPLLKSKLAASLACLALLLLASSASAVLVVTGAYQNPGTSSFTPTWTVANNSLIAGLSPTSQAGTFTAESASPGVSALTDGVIGPVSANNFNIYAAGGPSAGTQVTYTLPATAKGYNLTNITVYSGWGNGGRSAQGYTVLYSTVANPGTFLFLTNVTYTAGFSGNNPGTPISLQVMLTDSAGGTIAANVAAVQFIFSFPTAPNGENGGTGYSEITVQGNAASSVMPAVAITTATQTGSAGTWPFTPTWTIETDSLIAGNTTEAGNVTAAGNFSLEIVGRVVDSLTAPGGSLTLDKVTGTSGTTTSPNYLTCGGGSGSGSSIIYALTNSPYGSDVTNIVVYNGWADNGRDGQYYTVSYSTVSAPTTYNLLTTIYYLPSVAGNTPVANRVAIATSTGAPLGQNVANLKFDFAGPTSASGFNNGYQGYAQIIVEGTNSAPPTLPPSPYLTQDTLPSYTETVVGDRVVFTAAYSNAPPANLQWLCIRGGVTNVLTGQTSATLTLNNVQTNNAGTYTLKAVNATNGLAVPSFSSGAPLVVHSTPAAVGNIVMLDAEQLSQGAPSPVNVSTNFLPTWTVDTANDLILNSTSGSGPGTFVQGSGNFNLPSPLAPNNPDPTILSDGSDGYVTYWPNNGGNLTECSCGTGGASGAGDTMTYTLPGTAINGFDLTNITVYGGWGDAGRNEQKYQVLYSTVLNPSTFISLGTFDYNPNDAPNLPTATRTMLIPVTGALAKNVAAVEINWNVAAGPKNNWEGYSEIVVQGTPSLVNPVLVQDILPAYAETVAGDQVIFTVDFSNAPEAELQWQFIDTNNVVHNLSGQTTGTLTLNNVQLTNTGSYRLEAINQTNSLAVIYSSAAPLVVNPVPAPINNVIIAAAGQTGWGPGATGISTDFTPTWTANTNNDLVLGSTDGGSQVPTTVDVPGMVYAGLGNFALASCSGDPAVLSDGVTADLIYNPGTGGNPTLDSCGDYLTDNANYAGVSITYALPAATNGWSLTNITVYGGWGDNTQNEQKYQVLYSTVSAPTNFIAMTGWVDYAPTDPNGWQSATRTTLTAATGAMAQNVYAVQISFNNQAAPPKNNYSGYSEIIVAGQVSPPVPILTQNITPVTAEDVVGSQLTLVAGFSGATSYQWQKNGTNLPGATAATLTLSNLRLTDTATNGGYRLVAFNSTGSNVTASCNVFVDPAPTAVGNVVAAVAYQTSAASGFSPTWDTSDLTNSLLYQQDPPGGGYGTGNFAGGGDQAAGLSALTDGNYGAFASDGTHPAFAACGPNAGQYVIYTLGANPNGYDITNIQIAGGWNDNGRDSQFYTVFYTTVTSPGVFIPLASVQNNLNQGNSFGGGNGLAVERGAGDEAVVRTTFTSETGLLAGNVAAIYVDFTTPQGLPNAYSGYSEISVFGSASASDTLPIAVTATNENTSTPDWVLETDSLIENQLPSSVGPGSYAGGFNGEQVTEGLSALTDGTFGPYGFGTTNFATCGGAFGAGSSVTYTAAKGIWNLTNIVVYSGWGNYNRDGQFYNISYSTLAAPTTFIPLTSVIYNPPVPAGVDGGTSPSANRVDIAPSNGAVALATNVYAVKFDFTPQTGSLDNGYSGYAEIVLQGSNLFPPLLARPKVSGGNLILTGTGGTPNAGYTWLGSTNLATPLANWTVSATGTLDNSGSLSNAIPLNITNPASFFRLRMP